MGLAAVTPTEYNISVFETHEDLVSASTDWIAGRIKAAISKRGMANLALSGGSTPKPVYAALSRCDLLWESVWATLVDDRLTDDPSGSNAVMVNELLKQNKARKMIFRALKPEAGAQPQFDVAIVGMGTDGHTASWFPGSRDIQRVLDPKSNDAVQVIDAAGCPGAGNYPKRITLSLPALMNSRDVLLLITGAEKLKVFEQSAQMSVYDAPVKALRAAGPRLTVMWAP
ncbi:MAG: 6-phosphogluconolactonase [Hellea sp.]|nr:6-phosphogluconolactonase [Hellea sp.]